VVELVEATIDEVYECKFSEKKNKLNIKRKPSQKQKDASKANLYKVPKEPKDSRKLEKMEKENQILSTKVSELKSKIHMLDAVTYSRAKITHENDDSQNSYSQEKNDHSQENSEFPNSGFSASNDRDSTSGEETSQGDDELCCKCSTLLLKISEEEDYGDKVSCVADIKELLTMPAFSDDVSDKCETYEKVIVDLYEAQIEKIRAIQSGISSEEKMEKVAALDAVFGKYGEVYEDLL
jgi:hypothetical protein